MRTAVSTLFLLLALAACEGDTIYLPPRGDAAGAGGGDAVVGADRGGGTGSDSATPPGDAGPPGADGTARPDAGSGGDVAPPRDDPSPPPDVPDGPATCLPNDDGVVTRDEVVPVFGAIASYLANADGTTVPVDVDGVADPDAPGLFVWDFRDGPRDVRVGLPVARMPTDAWYAPSFPPDVTYVTPLGPQTPDILGVFRLRGSELEMLGLASREGGPGRTLLVYDAPVALYRFPLERGRAWTVEASFRDARIQGAPQAGVETYRFTIDRAGKVILPNFTFTSVLRIRLDLTQTFVVSQGANTLHSTHYFYFTECVGEVARIVGPLTPETPAPPVTTAREFRRLGL